MDAEFLDTRVADIVRDGLDGMTVLEVSRKIAESDPLDVLESLHRLVDDGVIHFDSLDRADGLPRYLIGPSTQVKCFTPRRPARASRYTFFDLTKPSSSAPVTVALKTLEVVGQVAFLVAMSVLIFLGVSMIAARTETLKNVHPGAIYFGVLLGMAVLYAGIDTWYSLRRKRST